ncbi:hypothetical protein QMG61_04590 [Cryobacterium sp. PH31-AA6]|uniref:hypothetical protein n=1 Tax=Cryobacterium sp. PH31-AA6 TaxID=3046205 RepID=UPI0024BB0D93|nr:hypothetical protein [Cryobacterium sp. PH31-AA6]MDJ0323041.1 hypothetical protein [Cryobacterium sp. PH31-AA6]
MEDDLDRELNRANPFQRDSVPALVQSTQHLVASIAALDRPARRRRRRRNFAVGFGLGVVLIAGTGASAIPTILEWAPWEPDVMIEREFAVTGGHGSAKCVEVMRVDSDAKTADANADRNLAQARAFLQNNDWSNISVDLDDLSAFDRKNQERQGLSEGTMLAMMVHDEVVAEFRRHGHLGVGVTLSGFGRCDDGTAQ